METKAYERRKEYFRAYRLANRQKLTEKQREWSRKNPDKMRVYALRTTTPEHRKKIIAVNRENWRMRNRDKHRAYSAVSNALRSGKLIRPDRCSKCGTECKPQAHHHKGYDPECRIDVVWVCKGCHVSEHALTS